MKVLQFICCVARGAFAGIIFGILFNYGRWDCLKPLPNMDEIYKTREPNIPKEYLSNLSAPRLPISGERKVILEPWRVMNRLKNSTDSKHFMLFLVYARAPDAKLRFLSRLTWASVGEIEGRRIAAMFVVPDGVNDAQNKLLAAENDIHGDILQTNLDFEEKAHESLWILSGYQWCTENVDDRAEYIVNVNSEAFPFLPNLYEYTNTKNFQQNSHFTSSIHCGFKRDPIHKPREPLSKSYVKRRVYSESHFPSYCDPKLVIMSQTTMKDLFRLSTVTNLGPIPQGDVFVWGVLREKLRSGGEKNIVDATKAIAEDSFKPLWYNVNFKTSKASKDMQRLWGETKERFSFSKNENTAKHHVTVIDFPVSDPKKSPEGDMKSFIHKWARVPYTKRKRKTR